MLGVGDREGPCHAGKRIRDLRDAIIEECFKRGLARCSAPALRRSGLSPPLLIDEEQADCAVRHSVRERFPPRRHESMPFPCWWRSRYFPSAAAPRSMAPAIFDRSGFRVVASGYRTQRRRSRSHRLGRRRPGLRRSESPPFRRPPEDAVGSRKQQRVIRAAQSYIARYRLHDVPYRFDILAVTVASWPRSRSFAFFGMPLGSSVLKLEAPRVSLL